MSGDFNIMGMGLMIVVARSLLSRFCFMLSRDSADIVTLGLLPGPWLALTPSLLLSSAPVGLNLLKLLSFKNPPSDLQKGAGSVGGGANILLSECGEGWLTECGEEREAEEAGLDRESRKERQARGRKDLAPGEGQLLFKLSSTLSSSFTWSEMSFRAELGSRSCV